MYVGHCCFIIVLCCQCVDCSWDQVVSASINIVSVRVGVVEGGSGVVRLLHVATFVWFQCDHFASSPEPHLSSSTGAMPCDPEACKLHYHRVHATLLLLHESSCPLCAVTIPSCAVTIPSCLPVTMTTSCYGILICLHCNRAPHQCVEPMMSPRGQRKGYHKSYLF